jgi:hypothetical protein
MKPGLFSLRWSLIALASIYLGMAMYITLASSMPIGSTLLMAIVTLIPALVLSSVSTVAGHAAAWVSVCTFVWAIRAEAFPAGGGAPMTLVAILLFGWPACIVLGAVAAGIANICSRLRRAGEPLK